MTVEAAPLHDPLRFVVAAAWPRRDELLRIPLRLSDRPEVRAGERVERGQPLVSRYREQQLVEIPTTAAVVGLRPGDTIDQVPEPRQGRRGRRSPVADLRGRVIEHSRDGITRLAVGSGEIVLQSPVSGLVESLLPGRIDVRAEGLTVDAQVGWGRPSAGRILVVVDGPDLEVKASRIDVSASGAILVAGARIDIEAMSRARAIGAAAVISGGMTWRDMRQMQTSEARQQAALHAAAPFGLLALGGYGRVPIPRQLWDLLVAAEGRPAGIHAETRQLVIGGDPVPLEQAMGRPSGTVRVMSGPHRDLEGRLVGLAGPRRWDGGSYAPGGFVEFAADDGEVERTCVPLAVLERIG